MAEVRELEQRAEHAATGEHDEHGKPHPAGEHDAAGKPKGMLERRLGKHRDLVIVILMLVSVVIAWLTWRARKSSSDSVSGLDPNAGASTTSGSLPGATGNLAGGDAGSGFDSYLANLSDSLAGIESTLQDLNTSPRHPRTAFNFNSMNHSWANEPVSAPARFLYGKAAKGLRYIRDRATGAIYQINPNGKRYKLNGAQYAELGKPKFEWFGKPKPHPDPPGNGNGHGRGHHRRRPRVPAGSRGSVPAFGSVYHPPTTSGTAAR